MDRNNIIGITLMVLLYVGYIWYTTPTEDERNAAIALHEATIEKARMDSIQSVQELALEATLRSAPSDTTSAISTREWSDEAFQRFGILAAAVPGDDHVVSVGSSLLEVAFSSRGGMPVNAQLKNYQRYGDGEPIQLWDPTRSQMTIMLEVLGVARPVSLADLHFEMTSSSDSSLALTAQVGSGQTLQWMHSVTGYQVASELIVQGLDRQISEDLGVIWDATGIANEKGLEWEVQHSSIYFREEGKGRDYLSDGRPDDLEAELPLEWVAFKQNFFSAIISSPDGFAKGAALETTLVEDDTTATMRYQAALPLSLDWVGSTGSAQLNFYFGPNEQYALEATNWVEADRIIDYGWWIFGWVNRNAILPLYSWLAKMLTSAGLIILLITLIIKLGLSPITWKNFKSSAKMKLLRPEIDALNEKHKDDAMAKQQATMALYRQTGVNPLAGCLPALLQMPILYAMFRFFPANISMRGTSFLWADDLGAYDSILDLPFNVPFYGSHVSGFTLLMAASTFFYMRLTMANQPPQPQQAGMPNMKVIQQIFPFMMLFFFNRFASGLSLYYFASNVISIGQMYAIKAFFIDEDKIREKIESNKAKPKKKSNFQERLENIQKEQAARTKEIKSSKGKKK